ncbi:MAG TPA: DUF2800 domain-containing protein [Terracidiphilus sp.]|nr:DUF2800 domain-containing protein [Terracidiphilus sp.]
MASRGLALVHVSEHSKLPPSGAERWMTCPGSVVLSDGMPESESEYAAEGTRAHAFSERWLTLHFAQHGSEPSPASPEEVEIKKNVKVYIDECISLAIKESKVFVEKKVSVNADVYGTADFISWHPSTATIYVRDLKYGAGVSVDINRNVQLRIYALAALMTTKLPAKSVNIGIVQPRYDHPDGFVRSVDFDTTELLDLHADVMDAVGRVQMAEQADGGLKNWDEIYLKPSEKGCRWCLASPKCPALKNKAQALAKQVFSGEPVPTASVGEVLPPATGLAAKPNYDPLSLARTLDFLPILEGWIKNTREFAYGEAEKGNEIPDYKLVEKTAVRKWKDDVIPARIAKTLGVEATELFKPAELINIGDAVKLAPGENAKERDAVLEPFVERKSSGHTLVHVSNKRDPVRIDAKAAFAATTIAGILE